MSPDAARASLRGHLLRSGQDAVLRRRIGTSTTAFSDVTVRVAFRGFSPEQLVGGVTQQDSSFVMSQDEILANGWPGTAGGPLYPRNGDMLDNRTVQASTPLVIDGEIVRIDGRVKG